MHRAYLCVLSLWASLTLSLGLVVGASAQTTATYTNGDNLTVNRTTATGNPLTVSITGGTATENGVISGDGTLTKSGAGTVVLTGANTYTGETTVAAGTLAINGGGTLQSGDITANGGSLVFSGAGTSWTNAAATLYNGSNRLSNTSISDGATVTIRQAISGFVPASTGSTLTVSGVGTSLQADYVFAGYVTSGAITVANSGVLRAGVRLGVGSGSVLNIGAARTDVAAAAGVVDAPEVGAGASGTTGELQFNTTSSDGAPTYFTRNGTATGAGIDTGAGISIRHTAGYTVFKGNLNSNGATTIDGGTMQIGNGGTTGSIQGNITNNGALVFDRANAVTYGSTISGSGSVTKLGAGTLTLSGASTYSGGTTVSAGTVLANNATGSAFGSGNVTIANGATLGGSGFIGGLTILNGGASLAPGNSPGTLTFNGGLTLNDGSILNLQLGTASDLLRITGGTLTGSASIGGITLNLSDSGGFGPATYTLFDFTGATLSGFDLTDFSFGSTPSGYTYSLALVGDTLQLTAATAVPEPATYAAIAGLGALGIAAWHRRRQHVAVSRRY